MRTYLLPFKMLHATLLIVLFVYGYGEEMNRHTAEENELVLQKRFEDLRTAAGRNGDDPQNSKNEIAEINRVIQILEAEIENAKSQRAALETAINEAAVKDGKHKLAELEAAMQKAKQDMGDYQALINVKMALSIETAPDKKMLEGEEHRYGEEMNRRTAEENELVLQKRRAALETAINEAEERGEVSVKDAKHKPAELDAALQKAKRDMGDYQALLKVKIALDIEIATYRALLLQEHGYGEEMNKRTAEENAFVLQKRFEDLRTAAGRNGNDLQNSKNEITELNRLIQTLKREIESVKSQMPLIRRCWRERSTDCLQMAM